MNLLTLMDIVPTSFFVVDESGIYEHSPTEDPDDVLLEKSDLDFKTLLYSLRNASLPHDFVVVRGSSEDIVISDHNKTDDALSVRMSVILYPSKATKVMVHRREARIPASAPGIDFTVNSVVNFLDYMCELSVCMGNPDDDMQPFIPTVDLRKDPLSVTKKGISWRKSVMCTTAPQSAMSTAPCLFEVLGATSVSICDTS